MFHARIASAYLAMRLGETAGGIVTITSLQLNGWDRATINGVELAAPNWTQAGARIARIDRIEIEFDLLSLVWGQTKVRDLALHGVEVTLVEDIERGSQFNFQQLQRWTAPTTKITAPILIDRAALSSLTLSFHKLRGGVLSETSAFAAEARLEPSPDDPARSLFDVRVLKEAIHASGWWNQQTLAFDLEVEGLSVGERLALILPRPMRALATQVDAKGEVTRAHLSHEPGMPFHGVMELTDVRATLPTDGFSDWVRYEHGEIKDALGYPQVRLRTGTLELTGSQLAFKDLDFELVNTSRDDRVATLPVRASLTLDFASMTREEFLWEDRAKWAAQVRDLAGFELRVMVPHFSCGKSASDSALEVPRAAAEFMRSFGVTELTFDLGMLVTRQPPFLHDGALVASPLESSATLVITDGVGAFEEFPYPLHDVQATVRFTGMDADIADLRGLSPQGDNVIVHGTITEMGSDAGVDLTISSGGGPIDSALINSFPEDERALLSSLFWHEGFASLQAAGVLFDAAQVARATEQLPQCDSQLRALTVDANSDPMQIAELAAQAGRLRRIIDQGAFTPGGRVAFTLNLSREATRDAEVIVTGDIRVLTADILSTTFPYPVRATGGELVIHRDRIEFARGVPFHTLSGAQGMFDGRIDLTPGVGPGSFQPHLTFALTNEKLNPVFVMAIPPAAGEVVNGWPGAALSKGGAAISQFDVQGDISLEGTIGASSKGQLDVQCEISLDHGSIHPVGGTGDLISESSLGWPAGFGLDDCTGHFRVDERSVEIDSFHGSRRDGRVEAHGIALLDGSKTNMSIGLRDIDLAEYAINLLPHDERARAEELWARYQPRGRFDADIVLASAEVGGPLDATLTVTPHSLGLVMGSGPMEAHFDSGTVQIHNDTVSCQSLTGTIGPPDGLRAELCLHGRYGGDQGALDLTGSVRQGLIHGPVVRELATLLSAGGASTFLDRFGPQGLYDADFSYSKSAHDANGAYEIDAWVHDLSVGDEGGRLDIAFEAPPHIHARSEHLEITPCRGTFVGGSLSVCGWLTTDASNTICSGEFQCDLEAIGTGSQVIAALPPGARDPLHAMGFTCADIARATTNVQFSQRANGLETDVHSTIHLFDAGISASVGLSSLDAHVVLDLAHNGAGTSLLADVRHAAFRIADREVADVRARIRLAPGDSALTVEECAGSMGEGRVCATARIETAAPYAYEAELALGGVPLAALTRPSDGVDTTTPAPQREQGLVDARVGVGGDFVGISSRRGRGSAIIREAELARLPIALALLQVTQLSLAFNSVVERGEFQFTIDQNLLNFQTFNLSCKDVILDGDGWLNIESTELGLRLRNQGRVPIVSAILGGVSNQIFQLDVRGTLREPIGSIAPLPALIPAPAVPIAQFIP